MDEGESHQFDRRSTDLNVAALTLRMKGLEGRIEVLEQQATDHGRELRANTEMTKLGLTKAERVEEAIFGRDDDEDDVGVKGKVKEMHDVFTDAKRGLAFLNRIADVGARWGKPVAYLAAVITAIVVWWKTGEFHLPGWPQ